MAKAAKRRLSDAARAFETARRRRDAAIRAARPTMSLREIAEVVGLSHTHVQRIERGGEP
jgi:hypothetical protein